MTLHPQTEATFREAGTLLNAIAEAAERDPGKPAVYEPGKEPLTYGELIPFVDSIAHQLSSAGIRRNDRVCLVAPNGSEMAAAFLAVTAIASCAPLNPVYSLDEFKFYMSDIQAKALIVNADMPTFAAAAAQELGIPVIALREAAGNRAGIFELDTGANEDAPAFTYAGPGDVALVLHTSGTTGRPKIVPLTHTNLTCSVSNIIRSLSLEPQDRCLNVMPLFHVHGLIGVLLTSLVSGGSVVCTRRFDAAPFVAWLSDFSPTWYSAVPTMHQSLLQQMEKRNGPVPHSLRFIRSSSSALPPNVADKLEAAFDVPVVEAYSMTEAAHQMTVNPLIRGKQKRGSVGKAAYCEVAIMDGAGMLLATGETGEIVVRGKNVIAAYENNPRANESSFTGGWFRTGDQGFLDQEGYLVISGRTKEMINRGGEKIFPREVDELLLQFPGVTQAAAFALPHPTLGEDLAAVVVLDKGAAATEKEIRQFAAGRISSFKVPSKIFFVEDIPKGPTGKVQRVGMADKLASQIAAARPADEEPVAAATPLEEKLVQAWSEAFGLPGLSVGDDFFDLGGNSIQAMQIIARIREHFGVELNFSEFFAAPTLREMAEIIGLKMEGKP